MTSRLHTTLTSRVAWELGGDVDGEFAALIGTLPAASFGGEDNEVLIKLRRESAAWAALNDEVVKACCLVRDDPLYQLAVQEWAAAGKGDELAMVRAKFTGKVDKQMVDQFAEAWAEWNGAATSVEYEASRSEFDPFGQGTVDMLVTLRTWDSKRVGFAENFYRVVGNAGGSFPVALTYPLDLSKDLGTGPDTSTKIIIAATVAVIAVGAVSALVR